MQLFPESALATVLSAYFAYHGVSLVETDKDHPRPPLRLDEDYAGVVMVRDPLTIFGCL